MVNKELANKLKKVYKEIEDYMNTDFPVGKELVWIDGKYKGRRCIIRQNSWEIESEGIVVSLLVKTERKDKKGFLEYDNFHRYYRDTRNFTTPEIYKVLYGSN